LTFLQTYQLNIITQWITAMHITFLLTPDLFSAHFIRRELSKKGSLLGIQVGTWPELLELARTSYCLPDPDDDWQEKIEQAMAAMDTAFWAESMLYDSETTLMMVADTLAELLRACGPGQQPKAEGLSPRGEKQLSDLMQLHEKAGKIYPRDLHLLKSLLKADPTRAIRSITVHHVNDIPPLDPWQRSLIEMLNSQSQRAEKPPADLSSLAQLLSWPAPTKGRSGLSHLQRSLFVETQHKQKSRSGLQWIAVRDYRQELEIAAGMVQKLLDKQELKPRDIALLLPDSPDYTQVAAEIFTRAGIPLSGLETVTGDRDLGRELISNFLLCRQHTAPPTMLRAALFSSPLLPWHELGVRIAQQFMDGNSFEKILQSIPEEQQITAKLLYGRQTDSAEQLKKTLRGLAASLAREEHLPEHRQMALGVIAELSKLLDQDDSEDMNWAGLLKVCRPRRQTTRKREELYLEGLRVFQPEKEPWQRVRHLLVLGFNEGRYPQLPPSSPILSEGDRSLLEAENIILPRQETRLLRGRNRFLRQLRAASESVTFFVPRLDSRGAQLSPSASLDFMALLFDNVANGEELLLDPEKKKDRQQIASLALAARQSPRPPRKPAANDLELAEDLLGKRKDENGQTKAESPSGMEKMMVSPFAWLLNRFSITSHEWAVETLDALVIGSIAHEIFEHLCSHRKPLPHKEQIPDLTATLFNEVVKNKNRFSFLLSDAWQVERRQMIREFSEAAQAWSDFLRQNKLEILAEEIWLGGQFHHQPIRGKADLVCRSATGALLVVDYKTSKSTKRLDLMSKGYDHQASLYCRMLKSGKPPEAYPAELEDLLKKSPRVHALYYTLRDQAILGDPGTEFLDECQPAATDIAHQGLKLIKKRMEQLRTGLVELNSSDDQERYPKETGITPYALDDSPLISLFLKKGEAE